MRLSACVSGVVAFLRARYPNGAPPVGYAPLLALAPRRVSDDEVGTIARRLLAHGRRRVDSADIGVEITLVTDEMPSPEDIRRVQRRLAATGTADTG